MFVVANFISAVANILGAALTILYWLIIIRALISWVNPDPYNPIVEFLNKTTEPILYPIRKILPAGLKYGIDISPLIAVFVIYFIKLFLVRSLVELALRIG